uniref:Protein RER1 n=1 Tax=Hyaloperonospora arabidopsidis (strain Emoy2) TaxID=559515 RepID=M4BU79_HYAAE
MAVPAGQEYDLRVRTLGFDHRSLDAVHRARALPERFLHCHVDTENDGPLLPHKQSEEFRPFTRRVPEFQFWYSTFKATTVSLLMTLSDAFNVPVFWPILFVYFVMLFTFTMKRQIKHMWKHNYVPWDHGKQVYKSKKNAK